MILKKKKKNLFVEFLLWHYPTLLGIELNNDDREDALSYKYSSVQHNFPLRLSEKVGWRFRSHFKFFINKVLKVMHTFAIARWWQLGKSLVTVTIKSLDYYYNAILGDLLLIKSQSVPQFSWLFALATTWQSQSAYHRTIST